MARHEIVIHENTGALAESAPYLGSYIAKETLRMEAFASAVGAKCGLPAIQVMAILGGAFEAVEALERGGLVRVWTDLGVVCAVITGSLPTADAAFDPERNALELVLRLGDDIRYALTDTVPAIITDEDLTKLRVDNVMDLEEERPMNLIHGRHVFRVAGFNMVLDDEGAAAYLENGVGTTFPLAVDEVVSKQLFKAHTAELLPAGDYKLVVKSRAGDAQGPLQTSFRRVKYMRVADPEPTPLAVSSDGTLRIMTAAAAGSDWVFTGSGFALHAPGGRGIPHVKYEFGEVELHADDFVVGEGGASLSPSAETVEGFLAELEGQAACDGTATVFFAPGSETPSEELTVPVRYTPAS